MAVNGLICDSLMVGKSQNDQQKLSQIANVIYSDFLSNYYCINQYPGSIEFVPQQGVVFSLI